MLLAGLVGVIAATQAPCRANAAAVGLVLAAMGSLMFLVARTSTARSPLTRGQDRAWRRAGPLMAAFGAALGAVALIGYLAAGPGTCG